MNKKAKCSEKVRGLLCFIAIFALSANISAKPQQEDVLITLKLDGVALQTAIDHIEEQSPYLFMNSGVDMDQAVSLNVTEQKIAEVCEALFSPINVSYRIEARHIYISNQPAREEVKISGTIIDTDGFPIPGAAVIESGTSNGTTTDMDGNFALTVSGSDANIEITSLGYDTQVLPVGSRTLFRITLQEEAVALEGTVVTALGIRRDEKALSQCSGGAGRTADRSQERKLHQRPFRQGGRRDHQRFVIRSRRCGQGRLERKQVHQPVVQCPVCDRRHPDV